MKNEQNNRISEIISTLEYLYTSDNGWTEEGLESIHLSPIIANFDITVKDNNGNILFRHYLETDMVQVHNEMMRNMGRNMMRGNSHGMMINDGMIQNVYELKSEEEVVGRVDIGYIGPFLITEREIQFSKGINRSIFFAAIISILAAIILGLYFSKIISNPIIKITEAANSIREGRLDTRVQISNNTTELQELSKSINHLSKSLFEQEDLRKRLTSDISHELRTPLAILQSHLEAFADGIWEPSREKINICKNEVIRLTRLVEQLKGLTDIENHKINLEIEKFNLSQALNETVDIFSIQFKEKNIILNKDVPDNIFIEADKDKVNQIIINILSNAIKHSNPNGEVDISLEKDQENLIIKIKDNGIGIDKEDLPLIFERFYRSDKSRSRKTGGAGIGLTITKTLVEAHNGRINVDSEIGVGSSFTVILPKEEKK